MFDEDYMTFKMVNDEGEEIECVVLLTFENEEAGHGYIVYTDNTTDEDGNLSVYASLYDPDDEEFRLMPIESPEEWELVESVLAELQSGAFDEEEE